MQNVSQFFGKLVNLALPGSGGALTIHFLLNHQWTAAAISSFVTLLLALVTIGKKFVRKVLDRLEDRLLQRADPFADWILSQIDQFFFRLVSRFRRNYYQSLIYTYRSFRTQGLSIAPLTPDLEKVFVPLRVQANSLNKISAAMIQQVEEQRDSDRSHLEIWNFLATAPGQRIAVLGPPGSGKTTLLEHLTLTYARNKQRQHHRRAPRLIPVLLYLREWRDTITREPNPSLIDLIEQQIKRQPADRPLLPPSNWFKEKLEQGKCLIMLDGLDEIADTTQRQQVSRWVNQQMQSYPRTTFILTSRPFGYDSVKLHLNQVTIVLGVQQLNLHEIEQFIHNWYLQNEVLRQARQEDPGVRQIARQQAEDLIRRIKRNPPIAAMALNPLLLTMIATVHSYRGALPGRRVELYAEICDVLLGRRQEAKDIPDKLTAAQKKAVLQVLALNRMRKKTTEFKLVTAGLLIQEKLAAVAGNELYTGDFLQQVENVSGLIVEKSPGIYEFAHKSFLEYLAAAQIKEANQELLLARNIDDPWWQETIRLYAAQTDASNLIWAALQKSTIGALALACECLEEGLSVRDQDVRKQLDEKLEAGLESADPEIFRLAAEVKLSRRLGKLLRIDDNTEIDTSYITCAEYQLFIDEKRQFGENRQPNYWTSERFLPGDANKPIVGIRASDAEEFCHWLTQRTSSLGDVYLEAGSPIFVGNSRFRLLSPTEAQAHSLPEANQSEKGQLPILKGIQLIREKPKNE